MRIVNCAAAIVAAVMLAAPAAQAQVLTTQAGVPALGPQTAPLLNYPQMVNPGFWPGWGTGWYQTPLNGYLTGVAAVTQANADYQVTIQQAKLGQEQARQAQLDTRRQTIDQARYEQSLMPNPEELRQKAIMESINRS